MKIIRYATLIALLVSLPALAHEEGEGHAGFLVGLLHPALGLDHLLAMLSVGILSAQIGGKAMWSIPLTFVGIMTIGAIIGGNNIQIPLVESGIALSVIALGYCAGSRQKHGYHLGNGVRRILRNLSRPCSRHRNAGCR